MNSKEFVGVILTIICVAFCLTSGEAAETRGLRIVAKDTASGQSKELKLYNKSYAVVIGIDEYQNLSQDRQLSYAVRDAKGVEEVLRKNFKFDKIITLYNREASKDNILKLLMGDLADELTEEDALFIFWAGHGNQEKTRTGDLGYLIPYDGSSNANELYKNITMSQIRDDISKKIPAKHVFYVMDACYGGLLAQTRAVDRQSKREFGYLQEITKEPVRQVLTAGGKDQEVLDGGPRGHSVFTGRLIEELEKAEDFVTANELQAVVKELVFSDARARQHVQVPVYGALYGVGDFVFVPSLERKAEDTQSRVMALKREMDRLKATEEAALKAHDAQAKRKAELEKKALEARLRAEQLKQQVLEDERKKKEREDLDRSRQEAELAQEKKADEDRLAALKRDVEQKRKAIGATTLSSLSPEKTLTEMRQIDAQIRGIRKQFRHELKNGISRIVERYDARFLKLADAKKDEFESEEELKARIAKETDGANSEQAREITAFQDRLEKEYNQQITPFIEQLKTLSANKFTIASENLAIELGTYDAVTNRYPITIRAKNPIKPLAEEKEKSTAKKGVARRAGQVPAPTETKYILLAANANVPIPREEAREFKKHFENNMLRAELKGNFFTPETFMVAQAYVIDDAATRQYDLFCSQFVVIDDASTRQYDLFSSQFVDLGNGTLYHTKTKLIWSKKGNEQDITSRAADDFIKRLNQQPYLGFRGWRIPTREELATLVGYAGSAGYGSGSKTIADFLNKEGFSNITVSWYWTSTVSGSWPDWLIGFQAGEEDTFYRDNDLHGRVLPVRSGK